MIKRKGISHLVAAIVLVAITLIGGIIIYSLASGTLFTQFKKTEVTFEYLGLYKSGGEPKIIFAGTIKNIGAKSIVKIIVQLHNESEYLLPKVSENFPLEPGKCVGFTLTEPDIHADWYIIGNAYSVRVYAEASDKASFAHTTTVRCRGTSGPGEVKATITFNQEGIAESVSGAVLIIDEGTAAQIDLLYNDLPFSITWPVGSIHTFKWVSPLSGATGSYYWSSTTGLSEEKEGFIEVPPEGGEVIAHYTFSAEKLLSEVTFDVRNLLFSSGGLASEEYSTLGESTFDATSPKIIYAERLFWAFYLDPPGAKIVYRTSEGGKPWELADWSDPVIVKNVTFDNPSVAVCYDGEFIHLVWTEGWLDVWSGGRQIYYMRGTPHSNGTISWGPENVLWSFAGDYYPTVTSVAVDTRGKLWVGFYRFFGMYPGWEWYFPDCLRVTVDDSGNAETEEFKELSSVESEFVPTRVVVVPMLHGRVMVIYYRGDLSKVCADLWMGSSWEEESWRIADCSTPDGFSATFDGKQLHLFVHTIDSNLYEFIWDEEVSDWVDSRLVAAGVPSGVVQASYIPAIDTMYVFWSASTGTYYATFNGTEWSEPIGWLSVGSGGISVNPKADAGKIGVLCWEGNTVHFGLIVEEVEAPTVLRIYIQEEEFEYTLDQLPVTIPLEPTSELFFEWVSPLPVGVTPPGYYGENLWISTTGLSTEQAGKIIVPLEGGSVIANYTQQWKYRLLVDTSPRGKGSLSPEAGEYIYEPGETVTVQLVSVDSEYNFMQWVLDGINAGAGSTIQVVMDQPHVLIAYLEQKDFKIYFTDWPGPPVTPETPEVHLIQGESTQEKITVEWLSGLPEQVTLSIPDAPDWLSYSFTPSSGLPDFNSTLTLSVSEDAPTGGYMLTVKGESPTLTRTTQFWLYVQPYVPPTAGITFYARGLLQQTPGVVLTVDGVDYTMGDLPVSFDWVVNSTHTFAWHDPLTYGDNYKFEWDYTSGLSNEKAGTLKVTQENGEVVGHYKTYIALTFKERGLYLTSETSFLQGSIILTVDGIDITFEELRNGYVYWIEKDTSHTIKWHKISTTFTYTMDCLLNGVPYEDEPFTCHFWNPKEDVEQTIRPGYPREIVGTYYTVFKYYGRAISTNDFNLTIFVPKMDLFKVGAEWYTTNNIDPRIYLRDWLHPTFSTGRILYYKYGDPTIRVDGAWELVPKEWTYHEAKINYRDVNKITFWINDWGIMTGVRNMVIVGIPYWADNY